MNRLRHGEIVQNGGIECILGLGLLIHSCKSSFQTMTQMATLPYCWTAPWITRGRGRTLVPLIFPNQRQRSYSKSLYRLRCPLLGRRYVHLWSSTSNAAAGESSLQDDFEETHRADMSSKLAKLGLAAIPAYGLFDGLTRRAQGESPSPRRTSKHFLGLSPFRVAGAAALAPMIDKSLKRIQKYFNFPSLVYAFALVVAVVACASPLLAC